MATDNGVITSDEYVKSLANNDTGVITSDEYVKSLVDDAGITTSTFNTNLGWYSALTKVLLITLIGNTNVANFFLGYL